MGAAPLPQPEVLHLTCIPISDPTEIAYHQGSDPLLDGEGDHLLCGFMLRLVNATTMARFDLALPGTVASPTPRPSLPRLWSTTGGLSPPRLLILKMEVALGAERPPGHQEPSVLGGDRVRMDDAEVHPSDPVGVEIMTLDRDRSGDR
ncbi:MAG TPA: hypothetical protein VFC13_02530 [Actinomycetes bacterium]|nr:hypothetical protein [Actinomycetes bacterium]